MRCCTYYSLHALTSFVDVMQTNEITMLIIILDVIKVA